LTKIGSEICRGDLLLIMLALSHSGHDFKRLAQRWRELAASQKWTCSILAEAGGFPILQIQHVPEPETRVSRPVYFSAGVHGDECAAVWGLLFWAEQQAARLSGQPFLIFPCFNPYGLVHNTRVDQDGVDLNRIFHEETHPVMGRWQAELAGRRFERSVHLHEDYDATGIYLYELSRELSQGDSLIRKCEDIIPRERDGLVDGREFVSAVRCAGEAEVYRIVEEELGGGMPEAIYLFLNQAGASFTFESPSEFDLGRRIEVHRRFLDAVMGW
jgi:murein peptide amidase A